MKRLTILFLVLVSCFCAFATPACISEVKRSDLYANYGMDVYYDGATDEYGLRVYSSYSPCWYFVLSENDFLTFRKTVEKALDWENVAKSNEVSINKEIPNSSLSVEWYYYSSGEWIKNETNAKLNFTFSASRWEFWELYSLNMKIIDGENSSVVSFTNGRVKENWGYVEGSALTELSNAISKKTVDSGIKKLKVQANADSLFN